MKTLLILLLLTSCGSKADDQDLIKTVHRMSVNYCGQGNIYCIDYMEDCLLDEGIKQYNFCINDYQEHTKEDY